MFVDVSSLGPLKIVVDHRAFQRCWRTNLLCFDWIVFDVGYWHCHTYMVEVWCFFGYTIQGGFTKVVCYVLTKCIKMHPYLSIKVDQKIVLKYFILDWSPGYFANLQVEPQKWESPERWPVIIVLVGQEPNMTTGKRPSAMVVQELSQELTYHGNLQGRWWVDISLLEVPEVWSWSFWWEVSEWPPCHGHYTWSPILDVRCWPGTLEFPEHTGVPSQDCLIGALGFAHANLEGLHIFWGEGEKTVPQKHNISIKP